MAFTIGVAVFVVFNLTMGVALWFAYRESEQVRAALDAQCSPRHAPSTLAGEARRGAVGPRGSDSRERA